MKNPPIEHKHNWRLILTLGYCGLHWEVCNICNIAQALASWRPEKEPHMVIINNDLFAMENPDTDVGKMKQELLRVRARHGQSDTGADS